MFQTGLKSQTYVSFQQSAYTAVEGGYLDICLKVTGDWNFQDSVGFYMYIEKEYSTGNHFSTTNKELVFIDDTINCFSYKVGTDYRTDEDKDYKFKLTNYEHQKDIIFSPINEIDVTVKNVPSAKALPPRGLFFSGIANTGGQENVTAFYLTNSVAIEPGTSFSLVSGNYTNTGGGNGNWTGNSGNSFSTIYVIYVGDQVIEEGNNFCIFITDINPLDLGLGMTISIGGIDQTSNFIINSGGTPNDIKIDNRTEGSYYITQGEWYKKDGEYRLAGSVIDGISFGKSKEEVKSIGIPADLGGGMTILDGTQSIDGSFYAILVCDGLIYICDITEYILNPVNWESYIGVDGQVDLQALCDDLCGYATDCEEEEELKIEVNDCILSMVSQLPCDDPLTYTWKHLINGHDWITVDEGLIVGGVVPEYMVTDNGLYVLEIECEGGCSYSSNTKNAHNCEDCLANITIVQSDCRLIAQLTNCNGNPVFQWYKWIGGEWIEIAGETSYIYKATEPGNYRVKVNGCENCDEMYAEYEYTDQAVITMEKEELKLLNYVYCGYWNYLFNITINGQDMKNEPEYHFPYIYIGNSMPDIFDLADDINTWFDHHQYFGHARVAGGKPTCLYIDCTDREFQTLDLIWYGNLVHDYWELIYDSNNCIEYQLILRASAPCTPISFLWSTGETTETIVYNQNTGNYSVTVTCENGCVYTGEKHFTLYNMVQNNENNGKNMYKDNSKRQNLTTQNKKYINIYPVPASDMIKIDINIEQAREYEFEIYNLLGDKVKTIKRLLRKDKNIIDVDTSELPSGVYLLKVKDRKKYDMKKIVITRK